MRPNTVEYFIDFVPFVVAHEKCNWTKKKYIFFTVYKLSDSQANTIPPYISSPDYFE